VGNEEQQSPLPEQRLPGQQGYYGWQYEQNYSEEVTQQAPPAVPPSPQAQQPLQPPPYPSSGRAGRQPNLPASYDGPILDMGTSLGYGQGMEYQYFDTPQPSQPMAQLRQERLQQLREERMRRQQRRMKSDITTFIPWQGKGPEAPPSGQLPPSSVPVPDIVRTSSVLPYQIARKPGILQPPGEALPLRSVPVPGELAGVASLQPAAAPAQDTAIIQRLRIGKATLILTFAYIASRFLGLARTSMFAFVFGTSGISDSFYQAFLIPDLIFNIVAGGALSSAFIPVFTHYVVAEKDEKTAWHIASSALNLAIAVMVGLALLAFVLADWIVPLYNPGVDDPQQLHLITMLVRIMLLQCVILGAGVIITSILNARQDFRLPAIGTVLYNVGIIVGLLPGFFMAFVTGQRDDTFAVYCVTWGVVVGAVLQVGIQIPGLMKVGMSYSAVFDWRHPGIVQMARQMGPRVLNASMLYLSTFVDRALILLLIAVVGEKLIEGMVTQYYLAFQLVLLPLGIFGSSVSTAAFPTLAENVAKGRLDRVRNMITETLRGILFMSIPSSVGLIVLGVPIIQVLLQHGRFSLDDAQSMAVPLAFFAVGLAGHALVEILTRSFYALRDSTTPVIVSVGQFIFKIALSLLLINAAVWGVQWGLGALAFATSFAALLEAVVMFWLLHQRIGGFQLKELSLFCGRVALAALAMGVALFITRSILDFGLGLVGLMPFLAWVDTLRTPSLGLPGTLVALGKLLIEMFVGVFAYVRVARLLGIEEMGPLKRVLDRLKLSWI
jgi:putative peptidoglycan lipid II flippase